MVSVINSWAQGIILAVIVATIIEIILPEGNNKKYVKTIIGIYILFVMVQPLISKISNENININCIIQNTTKKMNEYETKNLTIETDVYIKETYISKLKEDITQKVKEKGYNVNFLDLNIETENEELYGEINNINIQIAKIEEQENAVDNTIQKINNIEIKILDEPITNKENVQKENIAKDEIKILKEYFSSEYGISKEKIHINE